MKITNRYTDNIITEGEFASILIAVNHCLSTKISLSGANLSGADLSGADLRDADLSRANLRDADLSDANGNMNDVFSMRLELWPIVFTKDVLSIGCQQHSINNWKNFCDDEISDMSENALYFWKKWSSHIFRTIELCVGIESDNGGE